MKKGQMELMGIAIIVILLSMVLLFVVKFVVLREPSEVNQQFAESELAANFLNTLLKTNAPECNYAKFSTLFQDCIGNYPDGDINCGGEYSCSYIRKKVDKLFENTFDEWKLDYYFMIYTDDDNPEDSRLFKDDSAFGEECTGDRKVKIQPLPMPPDVINLALFICD